MKKKKQTPEQSKKYKETYEAKHPFKNKYFKTRYRALKRGIEFTVSYEYFRDFCLNENIEGKTGRTSECLSVDRIDSRLGYIEGNLQILTVSENSSKGSTPPDDELPDWYLNRPEGDCPF